jgi:hypothetical protein
MENQEAEMQLRNKHSAFTRYQGNRTEGTYAAFMKARKKVKQGLLKIKKDSVKRIGQE